MRRALSIVLLILFSLPLVSPLFALTTDSDANLPACCRRNGAHRCYLSMRSAVPSAGTRLTAIPQHCPSYPAVVTPVRHSNPCLPAASLIFAEILSHPAVRLQTQARARISFDRSRNERGPPSLTIL